MKKIKHKWWQHLIFKYKVVETETEYHEYERFRYLVTIIIWIALIVLSPIFAIIFLTDEAPEWFDYQDGKNGKTERYTIYNK